jgi:hypothetical protein
MSTFNFPLGIDSLTPPLINDVTIVNANHVNDLRTSILLIENSLVGSTPFNYDNNSLIQDGYNIKQALETLDQHLFLVEQLIGLYSVEDGYSARLDIIESNLDAHRKENSWIDLDGYNVHGLIVGSYLVGTEEVQLLNNKRVDSGIDPDSYGPKFVARTTIADIGSQNDMIQVFGVDGYTLVSSINYRGDAYFAGDIIVEGDRVVKGTDVVQNSLTVEGSTILGNNASLDTLTIKGNTSIDGTLNVTQDVTLTGSNLTAGNGAGSLIANYNLATFSNDAYVNGSFTTDGGVTLGSASALNTHLIRGSVLHSGSSSLWHSDGSLRVLGTKFRVESDTVYVNTSNFISTSDLQLGNILLQTNGNITSTGTLFQFGDAYSANIFLNGTTSTEDLIVANNISVSSGNISTPSLEASNLVVEGPVQIKDGSEGSENYVWTSVDVNGTGAWRPHRITPWATVVTDGYTVEDAYNITTPLTPNGVYNAQPDNEVFAATDAYGSFIINLPAASTKGTRVRIVDSNGSWSSLNKIFVYPQSGLIMGQPFIELQTPDQWVEIVYNGSSWRVLN